SREPTSSERGSLRPRSCRFAQRSWLFSGERIAAGNRGARASGATRPRDRGSARPGSRALPRVWSGEFDVGSRDCVGRGAAGGGRGVAVAGTGLVTLVSAFDDAVLLARRVAGARDVDGLAVREARVRRDRDRLPSGGRGGRGLGRGGRGGRGGRRGGGRLSGG